MTTPTKRVVKTPGQRLCEYRVGMGDTKTEWQDCVPMSRESYEIEAKDLGIQPLTEDVPEPKTDGELLQQAYVGTCGWDGYAAEFLRLRAERDGDVAKSEPADPGTCHHEDPDNSGCCVKCQLETEKWSRDKQEIHELKEIIDELKAKSEPPANMNDAPVFMHANGFSTERNAVVAVMRSAGLDDTDFRLRDKLIFAASPWIQAERESAKKLDVTRETIADWYMEWRADQDTPRQSEWFAFLAAKINAHRGVRPVPKVTPEMLNEALKLDAGLWHITAYLNDKLAKQAGKVGG